MFLPCNNGLKLDNEIDFMFQIDFDLKMNIFNTKLQSIHKVLFQFFN